MRLAPETGNHHRTQLRAFFASTRHSLTKGDAMNDKFAHTPGKLSVSTFGVGFEVESENGTCIAQAQQVSAFDQSSGSGERKSNARRLAACWNACDGMGIESIEELSTIGGVPILIVYGDDVRRERDTLLAALKQAIAALDTCNPGDYSTGHVIHSSFDQEKCDDALIACTEAIAKVTGKTSEAA